MSVMLSMEDASQTGTGNGGSMSSMEDDGVVPAIA
jgi:hypothetical protein